VPHINHISGCMPHKVLFSRLSTGWPTVSVLIDLTNRVIEILVGSLIWSCFTVAGVNLLYFRIWLVSQSACSCYVLKIAFPVCWANQTQLLLYESSSIRQLVLSINRCLPTQYVCLWNKLVVEHNCMFLQHFRCMCVFVYLFSFTVICVDCVFYCLLASGVLHK